MGRGDLLRGDDAPSNDQRGRLHQQLDWAIDSNGTEAVDRLLGLAPVFGPNKLRDQAQWALDMAAAAAAGGYGGVLQLQLPNKQGGLLEVKFATGHLLGLDA